MELWEAIHRRHSVRAYDPGVDVPPGDVTRIIEAAIEAPSGGNRQPWQFIVVRDATVRRRLAEAAFDQDFVAHAPVVIAVCADPDRSGSRYGERGRELYCIQDTAAAVEHILLAATALGWGTCWVGAFDESLAAQALDLPKHLRPVAMVPIGRPVTPSTRQTSRRPFNDVASYK